METIGKKELNYFLNQIENVGIHGLESNPLFLQLLIQYYNDSNKELTSNIYTLYDFVIKNILNWKLTLPTSDVFSNPNGYPKVKSDILEELAYSMLNAKQTQLTKYETNEFLDNWLKRNNYSKVGDLRLFIYEDLLTSKLLIESNNKVSFFHRSFMDYFSLSLIENEGKKTLKIRFYSKNSNFPLKLLFSKNQNLTFLKLYKPKKKNLLFLDREKASNWIFNYCCCLQSIKAKNRIEHDYILSIIKFLFGELDNFRSNKINLTEMFYDAKFGYENLFGALGELDYEPATEFYLNYLQKHVQFINYRFFGLEHFKFDIKNTEDILDFYLLGKHSYSFENSIKELILKDNDFVGSIILKKINASLETLTRAYLKSVN